MPYNLNMENIIIYNNTRDMPPSISSTILHVRCREHAENMQTQKVSKVPPFNSSALFST